MSTQQPEAPSSATTAGIRIGASEREDAVRQLAHHCSAGRITVEELDERVTTAMSAQTAPELATVLRDLPEEHVTAGRAPSWQAWIADGRALAATIPPRVLILAAGGAVLLLTLALFLLSFLHGFGDGGPGGPER